MVLIDCRETVDIEVVILNMLLMTEERIGLQIFHQKNNKQYIKSIVSKYSLNLSVVEVTDYSFITQYNDFMFSKTFYDNVLGEKILIFQTDSMLFRQLDMSYFKYDWIGAPWNQPTMNQKTLRTLFHNKLPIGNGGFNIRNIDMCRKIAQHFKYAIPRTINEDNAYSYLLQENANLLKPNFPSYDEASKFCVETITSPEPICPCTHSTNIMTHLMCWTYWINT